MDSLELCTVLFVDDENVQSSTVRRKTCKLGSRACTHTNVTVHVLYETQPLANEEMHRDDQSYSSLSMS
jgi:hypothetical protein